MPLNSPLLSNRFLLTEKKISLPTRGASTHENPLYPDLAALGTTGRHVI
jgi:hypothetical protein